MTQEKPNNIEQGKTNYVFKEFQELGFKIEKFPELFERLVELSNLPESHFEDAVKMEKIVGFLWDNDEDFSKDLNFTLSEFKLACLFHDIGKSGPIEANKRERKIIINQIFNTEHFSSKNPQFKDKNIKELTIGEALDLENFSNKDEIKQYLNTLTLHIFDTKKKKLVAEKLDLNKHTLIELWREHDIWTYQLLKKYKGEEIGDELVKVASSHHTLEGYDPAEIDGNLPNSAVTLELIDKYLIVTLVDKYQAYVDRSGKTHNEAIKIIRKNIEDSKKYGIINHEDKIFTQFIKYLEILERNENIYNLVK